jgi:prepilin-type N-terminal cleavage/methylation domain-containing protein
MKNKAFTLIEVLLAVTIFSLFIGASTGIFISSIGAQRKALAAQEVLDQTSYVMEYVSRALRMAKKDLTGNCITLKNNYQVVTNGIRFLNYNDKCQEIFLENNQIKEKKSSDSTSANFGSPIDLTSFKLNVNSFNIGPSGWDQNDDFQPKTTLFLEIESNRISKSSPNVKIQTTISQRNLDVMQ